MAGNHNSGRKPKYLTVGKFMEWKDNEFLHLAKDVKRNIILLYILLGAIIVIPFALLFSLMQIFFN